MGKCVENNVAYVPGGFFFPSGNNENYFRLNYSSCKEDKIVEGIKTFINQQFLVNEFSEVEFVNREEDLGIPGLRKAKLSYHPVRFVEKYTVKEA